MDTKKQPEERTNTFTKSLMSVIVFLYFVGALIGTALVILSAIMDFRLSMPLNNEMFIAYAAYLGGPTSVAIGFYAWKSKAENVLKISKSFETEDRVEVMEALSRIGGN